MVHDTFSLRYLRYHSLFKSPLKMVAHCKVQIAPELWMVVCYCSSLARVLIPLGHATHKPCFLTICFLYESLDSCCHTLTLCPLWGCCEKIIILSWRNVSILRRHQKSCHWHFHCKHIPWLYSRYVLGFLPYLPFSLTLNATQPPYLGVSSTFFGSIQHL